MTVTTHEPAETCGAVAETMCRIALDGHLKDQMSADPSRHAIAYRVARRSIAGETLLDAAAVASGTGRRM